MEIYGIHTVEQEDFSKYRDELLRLLPPPQQERIFRFRKPADLQRSLLGESMCRSVLAQKLGQAPQKIDIIKSEKGKPYLVNNRKTHFNLSHSGNWVVMAIHEGEVGIDVEKLRPIDYRIAQRFFSKEEFTMLDALTGKAKKRYFFTLWTIKESYLKYLGKGLTKALSSFTVVEHDGTFRIKHGERIEKTLFFHQAHPDNEHFVAVCSGEKTLNGQLKVLTIKNLI